MQFGRHVGHQVRQREPVVARDEGVAQGAHRSHRHHPVSPPGIDRRRHFGQERTLRPRIGRCRRSARRRQHAPLVRHRLALPQPFHRQVPHHPQALRQVGNVGVAGPAQGLHRAPHIHLAKVGLDRRRVRLLGRHPARGPHFRRRGVRVGQRQGLIGEPGIGDEPPRPRSAHHIAAPQRVDPQDRVARHLAHAFPSLTDPNHRYKQKPRNSAAETIWLTGSLS